MFQRDPGDLSRHLGVLGYEVLSGIWIFLSVPAPPVIGHRLLVQELQSFNPLFLHEVLVVPLRGSSK